ncbi:glycosyltransferase [Bdellovibrio bacteriovorus]|uniref:glycosyltransferase n=1 Tax=Bdellovibrio bacteriovorus TaxID=959 RepID=UPI003D0101AE
MDNMNILFLTHTNIEVDARILKEMGCLADRGYNVFGFGVRNGMGAPKTTKAGGFETYLISLYSRKLVFLPKIILHALSLVELTAKMIFFCLRKKPDLVHCGDTLVLPLGVLIKIFTGAKVIYDAHELESEKIGLSKTLSFLTLSVEKILWRWIDALVVVSPSIARWYMDNVGKKDVEIILNSPILPEGSVDGGDYLRKAFSIAKDSRIFLYVGVFAEGRGLDLVLEAFNSPLVRSSVVFLGYGAMTGKLKEVASKSKNIFVHDAVPHEKVVPIARSADYGLCFVENVSLSYYFSLPNKLFEYSFSGTPVLASEFPDIKAVIDTYGIGSYCSLDVESIRSKVISLQEKGDVARISLADLYPLSWKVQEEKLLRLYDKILLSE